MNNGGRNTTQSRHTVVWGIGHYFEITDTMFDFEVGFVTAA